MMRYDEAFLSPAHTKAQNDETVFDSIVLYWKKIKGSTNNDSSGKRGE